MRIIPAAPRAVSSWHSDEDLMAAYVKTKDGALFEILVRRHESAVRRFCRIFFRGEDDAEDAVQESFARLLVVLHRFRGTSSFQSYLYGICRNACRELARKTMRHERRLEKAAAGNRAEDEEREREADPALMHEKTESGERILAALRNLGEKERILVYLKEAEGVSIVELARIFRMPAGTIKSTLSRSRARLSATLGEEA